MSTYRIPPHSLEAEKAVLGALLTSEDAFFEVSTIVKVDDFYRDAHRIIYEEIVQIVKHNKRADLVLLVDALTKRKKLDEVGGIAYIASLCEDVTLAYNVEAHARIVSEKARLRRLIDVGEKIVGMSYEESDEASAIINSAEKMVMTVTGESHGSSSFSSMGEVMITNLERLSEIQQHRGVLTGVPTGFRDLDKITNGLQRSDLVLIAARPSMGKTAFTLNVAQNAAIQSKKNVAFFSLEMSKEQLVNRMLASVSGISLNKLRIGSVDENDWEALVRASVDMDSAPLYIDDTPGLTAQDMRSKLRRLKVERGLDLVIVDYIQLMQGSNSKSGENRQQEISEISRSLKLIARELNVPVIALSQLSRSVESRTDKRPILSDLRESGSLEQDADIVAFLYREKYYDEHTDLGDITEVIIKKHRNGELGKVHLMFQGELTRFRDVSYRPSEEQ